MKDCEIWSTDEKYTLDTCKSLLQREGCKDAKYISLFDPDLKVGVSKCQLHKKCEKRVESKGPVVIYDLFPKPVAKEPAAKKLPSLPWYAGDGSYILEQAACEDAKINSFTMDDLETNADKMSPAALLKKCKGECSKHASCKFVSMLPGTFCYLTASCNVQPKPKSFYKVIAGADKPKCVEFGQAC